MGANVWVVMARFGRPESGSRQLSVVAREPTTRPASAGGELVAAQDRVAFERPPCAVGALGHVRDDDVGV